MEREEYGRESREIPHTCETKSNFFSVPNLMKYITSLHPTHVFVDHINQCCGENNLAHHVIRLSILLKYPMLMLDVTKRL